MLLIKNRFQILFKRVAIITSAAVAFADIVRTAQARGFTVCKFYLYNSLMQGDGAARA